eukprot:10625680-Alexandrium_andersonii.AAC.1
MAPWHVPRHIGLEPWNGLRRFLSQGYLAGAFAKVAERRQAFKGHAVDIGLTLRALRGLSTEQGHMARAVLAGAIWTSHEAQKAGHQDSMRCPHCDDEKGDLLHFYWKCP